MARRVLLLLLLAGAAPGAGIKLRDLLDPADKAFRLLPYAWADWEDLDRATRLRAKAEDPAEWEEPPPDPEAEKKKKEEEEKKKKRDPLAPQRHPRDRHPGFRFDRRLTAKKQAFEGLMQPASPTKIEGVIRQLPAIDKYGDRFEKVLAGAAEEYGKIKAQLDKQVDSQVKRYRKKYGKPPAHVSVSAALQAQHFENSRRLQRLVALQQSERQWQRWLLYRLAELIGELSEEEREKPLAALARGVADKDWRSRLRCAEISGAVNDARARATLAQAIDVEQDPMVLSELIRIRARRGGKEMLEQLAKRLEDPRWPVRAAVIRELGSLRRKETVEILVAQLGKESGRLRDDVTAALKLLTRQTFGPEPEPWRIWWDKVKASWTPPARTPAEVGAKPEQGKGAFVYFYGIRTSSKRIVFCVDLSGSMSFPLDGQGGKKPPRIETARRELFLALSALPEDALFSLVTYNSTVSVWKSRMQPATLRNKQAARKFVERQQPSGSTNIYDALNMSLDIAAAGRTVKRKVKRKEGQPPQADTIFFLTDGVPTNGRVVDPHQIVKEITERNKMLGVVIHTVGVSKEQNAGFLLNLAKRNGGRYVGKK